MTQEVRRTIQVGQSLYGYQEGQSLLASSETLPRTAESTIFDLSDLSGPQLVAGFEEYLTGYPIPEVSTYAFTKTWYAPEMQRPGCVWTHALLVRSSDIAQMQDLSVLRRYFKRPSADPKSWSEYKERLEVPTRAPNPDEPVHAFPFLFELYGALYGTPEVPVLLPASNSKQFESLVLRIWGQQWPRLRRAFKFCTGSLENRVVESKPFDLQIIPFKSLGRIQHEIADAHVIQEDTRARGLEPRQWIATLADDFSSTNVPFREFLREFGADVVSRRTSFRKLVEAYNLQLREANFEEYWDSLLTLFPSQGEAATLKVAAALPQSGDNWAVNTPFSKRLTVLVTSPRDSSYPKRFFEAGDIEEALSEESLGNVLQVLATAPSINSFGESLIQFIAMHLSPGQLTTAASTPSALMLLLSRNPKLARFHEIWTVVDGRQQQLLDLISTSHLTQSDWGEVLQGAVLARVPNTARTFVRIMGVPAVHEALSICQLHSIALSDDWNSVFGEQTPAVAEWLRSQSTVSGPVLQMLAQDLNPLDSALLTLGSDIWQPILDSEFSSQRVSAFILLFGLQNPSGRPYELVAQTFEVVHDVAERERLDTATWILLRDSIPKLGYGRDWDVCERLRQLLINKYVSYSWPIASLFRTLQNPVTLDRTLRYVGSEKHLRSFGRYLYSEAESGSVHLTDAQTEVLQEYERKFRK
jgi:hypothetical protein